jgi:hypothetical protein
LIVFPYGSSPGDGGVEYLPHELAEEYSLLGGVFCKVVLRLACGLLDACLLLGLVVGMASAE